MTLPFEFGRPGPLPAAEMRLPLQCSGTLVLDGKGVYCSAHNAAVPTGIRDSESVGRTGPDTDKARHGGWPETAAAFLAPGDCRGRRRICSGGLASVVLLVGGAGNVIFLVILAAGAGVALAAGAGALAVLDVAVAAFGAGGGARAGGSAGYNTQNKPSRGCTSQAC
jgi:hypothetical protein